MRTALNVPEPETRRSFDWFHRVKGITGRKKNIPTAAELAEALNTAPPLLTMREVAVLYRRSLSTLRRQMIDGSFKLAPYETGPYRWRRVDVQADLLGAHSAVPPRRPRGRPRKDKTPH